MPDGADDYLFERTHVAAKIRIKFLQIQDRITDDLAGAVIGYVATAVGFAEGRAHRREPFFIQKKMRFLAAFSQCVHMRMRAKNQVVCRFLRRATAVDTRLDIQIFPEDGLLISPGFLIRSQTQILKLNVLQGAVYSVEEQQVTAGICGGNIDFTTGGMTDIYGGEISRKALWGMALLALP